MSLADAPKGWIGANWNLGETDPNAGLVKVKAPKQRKSEPKTTPVLVQLKNVTRVYSGKPGCMCGCLGKHYRKGESPTAERMVNKIVALLTANWGEAEFGESYVYWVDYSMSQRGHTYTAWIEKE